MRKSLLRRTTLFAAAIVSAGALALAGCSSNTPAAEPSDDADAGTATVQTITPGVLKIGSQQSYIPGEFFEEGSDQVQGFSVDFLDEIAKRLGLKPEWTQVDYSAIITGLQSGQFDMGSGGMFAQALKPAIRTAPTEKRMMVLTEIFIVCPDCRNRYSS